MLAKLIKVGNSKGIRIPSAILKQCHIDDQVEIEVKDNTIIIRPIQKPRSGWDDALKIMSGNGDDKMLIDINIDAGMDDWEWK